MRRASYGWVRAPRGPIPKTVQESLQARLESHARTKWKGRCRAVVVRFRGAYTYIDAFPGKRQYLPGTPRERRAIIDASPTRLCRLGYLGSIDRWS